MIPHCSPYDIGIRFTALFVTRSRRWRNRKNDIRQGILAVELLALYP